MPGKYHQVLGVNLAIEAVKQIGENNGRLGVFWHTQGSGKSLSMVMFAEKVLRRMGGNWTFVIITDRQELDDQIAGTFASVGALTKLVKDCQAQSRVHLRELLAGQERYVFTLIHKFSTADREPMPVLSERDDIIVITDEAHRSQYDQLAANMRRALPNAAFIGFTGTPLIAGQEERTREVFGDYVSVYNFAQSIADGATVPLYYEARKPELQLAAEELKDELDALLDEAVLDEEQEKKLQQTFGRQYHLITRNDRLDEIATDLVRHFSARGYLGKAMFVAIDKATAVRMYDKVRKAWAAELASREAQFTKASMEARTGLAERLDWMRAVDMAVVVSQGQNEIDDLKQKRLDILPHRERMQKEDLESKFKDPDDPLRLIFVCAMWIVASMEEEERRASREGLTEEELAVFDLLTRPKPKLSKAQEVAVKKVARELLDKLQAQLAVDQWQAKQQTRAAVQSTIRFTLNELPEEPYPEPVWNEKVDAVWAFIFARQSAAAAEVMG